MGLKINYQKMASADEAYKKVKSFITPEYIEKFQVKADIQSDDTAKKVIAKGSGFTLTLEFFESYCEADLELSLILRALKSKFMSKIEEQISRMV